MRLEFFGFFLIGRAGLAMYGARMGLLVETIRFGNLLARRAAVAMGFPLDFGARRFPPPSGVF